MDEQTARDCLLRGLYEIDLKAQPWERREDYYRGVQDLPFAPEGVNAEYMALREMAIANWLGLAMDTPIQRLRADGFRTGRKGDADEEAWNEVWQPNKLDARQRIVYTQMMVHGRGLLSVWPNRSVPRSPHIRVENGKRVHLEPDPEDPFTTKWAVKAFSYTTKAPSMLWAPEPLTSASTDVAVAYDDETWVRFEKPGMGPTTGIAPTGAWEIVDAGTHPLGEPPFVAFDNCTNADGKPTPGITPLMPAQDAINTVRFNTLLAMQFSAFRQRVFTGYDPVQRTAAGDPIYMLDAEGAPLLDSKGQKIPILNFPGRPGVDRALVFPGEDTKVFDLPESRLDNYIQVLGEFLTQFFAVAQIPPQYLLSRMANLSGDALAGAESTLASLVADLQLWVGESLESTMRLANRARGETASDVASEVIWADGEARSFSQTVDAITKLISVEFPRESAFEMIPGATPQKVSRWMEQRKEDQGSTLVTALADQFRRQPPAPEVVA